MSKFVLTNNETDEKIALWADNWKQANRKAAEMKGAEWEAVWTMRKW